MCLLFAICYLLFAICYLLFLLLLLLLLSIIALFCFCLAAGVPACPVRLPAFPWLASHSDSRREGA
jgi:hypothetical protein